MDRRHLPSLALLALLALGGTATSLSAQALAPDLRDTRYTGLGFAANIPNVLTGVAAFHHMPSLGVGVFGQVRFSLDSPERERHFRDDITPGEAFQMGDFPVGSRDRVFMGTAGVFRPITPTLALYVGVGYSEERGYREFYDETRQRGDFGYYWIEVDADHDTGLNFSGGALIQATRNFTFMGGFDSFPTGISVAGLLSLPW